MTKALRLTPSELDAIRRHALEHGGTLFEKMCPRPDCHSAVVLFAGAVVCLTCGWCRHEAGWGLGEVSFSPKDAKAGQGADFRALATRADPERWTRLIKKARERGDAARAESLELLLREAEKPPVTPKKSRAAKAAAGPGGLVKRGPVVLGADVPEVLIYTDGGCDPNPGPGGWGAILWTPGCEMELAGGDPNTTNNRMEMSAALEGLRELKQPSRVTVITDSQYLFNGMTGWITGWSKHGWTRKGKTLLNPDLWEALARAALEHESSWSWMRGHAGHPENERCDELATMMTNRHRGASAPVRHEERRDREGTLPAVDGKKTATVWLRE